MTNTLGRYQDSFSLYLIMNKLWAFSWNSMDNPVKWIMEPFSQGLPDIFQPGSN